MADLSISFAGIRSPNPFWLASGPPTNSGDQVSRAFDLGWGGCVWKTLGDPIVNVSSRFGAIGVGSQRMVGFNNIELITDRPIEDNLREIREVKRRFPSHAMVVSIMEDSRQDWQDLIRRVEDTGADGIELNFGCPHGMCERGMGSAVGQEPKVLSEITRWACEATTLPVLVKLTPNVSDILEPGVAAVHGGASGLSLINTIKSLMGVDLDRLVPLPAVGARSTNGGYCGPAVKPIALHMVAALARDPAITIPISGIGGIQSWRDAAEFIALGATSVQVCTAVMHYGFRIVEDLVDGLNQYLDDKGLASVNDLRARAIPAFTEWGDLDMNYKVVARIDEAACIGCDLCYVACRDAAVACIHLPERATAGDPATGPARRLPPRIDEPACIGCNLCSHVCPVDGCITMVAIDEGRGFESWNDRVRAGRAGLRGGEAPAS